MDTARALAMTKKLYAELETRRPEVEEFDDYYEGKHPLQFASREWSEFHKDRYAGFSDNWCATIPDAAAERIRVIGLSSGGELTDSEKRFADVLDRLDFNLKANQGFLESLTAKRSFILVWGKKGTDYEPTLTWEHPSQAIVSYDPETGAPVAALKAWVDGSAEFATLYTATEVWKFQRTLEKARQYRHIVADGVIIPAHVEREIIASANWEPRQPSTDDTWPIVNPLGVVPLIEIPNRSRLQRGPVSDIHGAKAMQDAINFLWGLTFAAADHASLPGRVVMGQQPPKIPILDKDGQQVGEKDIDIKDLQHGRMLWLTGQNAKIGEFTRANLATFTDVIEIAIGHMSAQTRVPAHYFIANTGMSNINGETLTATETPLVKKVEDFQLNVSGPLARAFSVLARVIGDEGLAASIRPSWVRWANAGIRSESQLVDALLKRSQIGYPFEAILQMEGLSPSRISEIMEMKQREKSDPDIAVLADRMSSVINA